jgi:hypothetical protein
MNTCCMMIDAGVADKVYENRGESSCVENMCLRASGARKGIRCMTSDATRATTMLQLEGGSATSNATQLHESNIIDFKNT